MILDEASATLAEVAAFGGLMDGDGRLGDLFSSEQSSAPSAGEFVAVAGRGRGYGWAPPVPKGPTSRSSGGSRLGMPSAMG